jgi:hypothetical protein
MTPWVQSSRWHTRRLPVKNALAYYSEYWITNKKVLSNRTLVMLCAPVYLKRRFLLRRSDTRHNDTRHNDVLHNDVLHNTVLHNDTQHKNMRRHSAWIHWLLIIVMVSFVILGVYITILRVVMLSVVTSNVVAPLLLELMRSQNVLWVSVTNWITVINFIRNDALVNYR